MLPQRQKILDEAYAAVGDVIKEVSEYVGEWLRYQVGRLLFFFLLLRILGRKHF